MHKRSLIRGSVVVCLLPACGGRTEGSDATRGVVSTGGSTSTTHIQTGGGTGATSVGAASAISTARSGLGGSTSFFDVGGTWSAGGTNSFGGDSGTTGACHPPITLQFEQSNIVFLLDASASMGSQKNPAGGYDWQNCPSRWSPVANAIVSFVVEPESARLNASLTKFPTDASKALTCSRSEYLSGTGALKVPLRSLGDAGVEEFSSRLCKCDSDPASACITPSGGTPTRPALQGAIDYARQVTSIGYGKTALVLISGSNLGFDYPMNGDAVRHVYSCDDLPLTGCDAGTCDCGNDGGPCTSLNDEIDEVANAIEAAPAGSVYVAGLGDLPSAALQTWSAAAGTPATDLYGLNPAELSAALLKRLENIRESLTSCTFDLPVLQDFRPDLSNVVFISGKGDTKYFTALGQNASACGSSLGWYYDSAIAPKQVHLCPASCSALRSDPLSSARYVPGCNAVLIN